MIRFEFSEPFQQYRYFITMKDIGDLKHVILELEHQGAKHPDALRTRSEFFMNKFEWQSFKDIINAVV